MRLLYKMISLLDAFCEAIGFGSMFLVFILMIVMVYEVVMRYVFTAPTTWAMELNGFLMLLFVPLAGAYVLQENGHINVDIIYGHLSPRGQAVMNVITFGLFFVFLYFFLRFALADTIRATSNLYTSGTIWDPPIWPLKILVTFGVGLVLLQGIAKFIRDLVLAITGKPIEQYLGEEKG